MAKSPEEQMANMIENLKEKTGKSLDEWVKLAKGSKLVKHGEIAKFLKTEHGMGHGYANLVAHKLLASDSVSVADAGGDLVGAQYAGAKAGAAAALRHPGVSDSEVRQGCRSVPEKDVCQPAPEQAVCDPTALDGDTARCRHQPQRRCARGPAGSGGEFQRDGEP